ncbi:diacylglycerol kinase family protein [Aerococcaceae bacterium DSM 111020]|nr:diacylglycerol kinase family protein [Aerococcaceae bacterium DSM 111020]
MNFVYYIKRTIRTFACAWNGIIHAVKNERNLRFHLLMTVIVALFSWLMKVNAVEWMLLILVIGGVITAELINTAIETTVNLVTEDYHLLAKLAKDVSAGAVLITAIVAVTIGLIIFVPKLIMLF